MKNAGEDIHNRHCIGRNSNWGIHATYRFIGELNYNRFKNHYYDTIPNYRKVLTYLFKRGKDYKNDNNKKLIRRKSEKSKKAWGFELKLQFIIS